jgi:hypothetical protein
VSKGPKGGNRGIKRKKGVRRENSGEREEAAKEKEVLKGRKAAKMSGGRQTVTARGRKEAKGRKETKGRKEERCGGGQSKKAGRRRKFYVDRPKGKEEQRRKLRDVWRKQGGQMKAKYRNALKSETTRCQERKVARRR